VKLFVKILLTYTVLITAGFGTVHLFYPMLSGTIFPYSVALIVFYTFQDFRLQSKAAKTLGITKDNAAYHKTRFISNVKSTLSNRAIRSLIQSSEKYLGKVKLDDSILIKQTWKGYGNMSKTQILSPAKNGDQTYKIITEPFWRFTLIDRYINYKAHLELKALISDN